MNLVTLTTFASSTSKTAKPFCLGRGAVMKVVTIPCSMFEPVGLVKTESYFSRSTRTERAVVKVFPLVPVRITRSYFLLKACKMLGSSLVTILPGNEEPPWVKVWRNQ